MDLDASATPVWDFFLAHAGADSGTAERLYALLEGSARVFLDSRSLRLGDDWDVELARAQKRSRVTVVLLTDRVTAAYYQREEIAAAIAMASVNGERHRVVPLYLAGVCADEVPYGLRLKHGIRLQHMGDLPEVASRLLSLLASLEVAKAPHTSTSKPPPTKMKLIDALLSGLSSNCTKARALQIEEELFQAVREDVDLLLESSNQYVAPAREAIAVVAGRLIHGGLEDQRLITLLKRLTTDPDRWVRKKAGDALQLAGRL